MLVVWSMAAPAGCTQETDAPPERANVPDDINDGFLDEELDPQDYVQRFEIESREIFACRQAIVGLLNLEVGSRIADIGCGTGVFTPLFAAAVTEQGKVYAVDISPRLIDFVQERVKEADLSQVEVVKCTADNVMLPTASVDVAFVCDTYHHFEYPQATLQSLRFALRPGGQLVVIDFERIPDKSREWIMGHVRDGKDVFRREIEQAGFVFMEEVQVDGIEENYVLRFRRP